MATAANNHQPAQPAYAVGGDADITFGNVGNIRNRQHAADSNSATQEKDQAAITFCTPNSKGGLKSIDEHNNMDNENCEMENTSLTGARGFVMGLGAMQGNVPSAPDRNEVSMATTDNGTGIQCSFQPAPTRRIPQLHRLEK